MPLHIDTDNDLANADGGYENITVTHLPAQPTVDFLRYLNSEVTPGDVSADCILHYLLFVRVLIPNNVSLVIDAVVVSVDAVVKATE